MNFLAKLYNLPRALRVRFSPYINCFMLKSRGVKFGRNLQIVGSLDIRGRGSVIIGDNFCFVSGESVNPICSNVRGCFYTDNPDASIVIGNNVGMSSTRMWIHDSLTIGDNVNIGACVLIIDTDCHEMDYRVRNHSLPSSHIDGQYVKSAPVTIEDDVWIGAHCIILKGVTIGARTVIGAGSVVTKSIPADCIAAGSPCRVIRKV